MPGEVKNLYTCPLKGSGKKLYSQRVNTKHATCAKNINYFQDLVDQCSLYGMVQFTNCFQIKYINFTCINTKQNISYGMKFRDVIENPS